MNIAGKKQQNRRNRNTKEIDGFLVFIRKKQQNERPADLVGRKYRVRVRVRVLHSFIDDSVAAFMEFEQRKTGKRGEIVKQKGY
jgi:hypothetical protein